MSSDMLGEKDWSKEIIDLYQQGASDAEVAAKQRWTIKSFYGMMEKNETFRQLIEFGRTLSLAWWESQPRKNITNKQFNSSVYALYMKNKHGWADRIESTTTNENLNTNLDDLRQTVLKQVEKFRKTHMPELTDAENLLNASQKDD